MSRAHLTLGTEDVRVSKEKAAENRERILLAAARLMRERGISGAGVDALTEAAGMTHGSLYSQFGSKERLVEEAVAYAIAAKGQECPRCSLSARTFQNTSPLHIGTGREMDARWQHCVVTYHGKVKAFGDGSLPACAA
jgi:AcrR family transcriptional regulator